MNNSNNLFTNYSVIGKYDKREREHDQVVKQDGAPFSESMSFISNYFTIFSSYPTAMKCRTAD